jgi:SAM-dependent methyltransferase
VSSSPPAHEAAPFDALAASYDTDFTESPIAQALRARVHARLLALTQPGARVLELGCGTGVDAAFLAAHGRSITATDASPAMRSQATARLAPFADARILPLDINAPDDACLPEIPFHLIFANFGVYNCAARPRELARWLAGHVMPGGSVGLCVMAPRCLWEMAWHTAHGNIRTAFRRWKRSIPFATSSGTISITYPSVTRVTRDLAPYFRRSAVMPLGLFLPPSDIYPVIEKHPTLLSRLMRLDNATMRWAALANLCDHYWIELMRTDTPA